jgi:hypothetical protein
MDLWEILGLLGILSLWAAIGCVPWFVALVATGAQGAPWRTLPIVLLVALAGAALVPGLGVKGWAGFWTSLASALLLSSAAVLLLGVRGAAHRSFMRGG